MLGKALALISLFAFVVLSAMLQMTTPSTIHPLGIIVVFILIYLVSLGVITLLLNGLLTLVNLTRKEQAKIKQDKVYYFASIVALAFMMVVGMVSIGRTSLYELALVLVFVLSASFYVAKR